MNYSPPHSFHGFPIEGRTVEILIRASRHARSGRMKLAFGETEQTFLRKVAGPAVRVGDGVVLPFHSQGGEGTGLFVGYTKKGPGWLVFGTSKVCFKNQ